MSIACHRSDTHGGNPARSRRDSADDSTTGPPPVLFPFKPTSGIEASPRKRRDADRAVSPAHLILVVGGLLLAGIALIELRFSTDISSASAALLLGLLCSAAGASQGGWIGPALASSARWLDVPPPRLALIPLGVGLAFASRAAAGDGLLAALPFHAGLWLTAAGLVILGCWRSTASADARVGSWEAWGVGGLLIAALLLRTIQLGDIPVAVSGDEGGMGLVAWEYVTRVRTNLLALGWFSFPGLYAWIVSIFQLAFGRTLLAIRLPSAVAGTLSVLALYFAARTMFGRLTAFLSATLLAGLHVHLLFSRVAIANVWDGLFLSLAMGGLWRGWRDDHRGAFLLAGVAVGLSQYFYATARLLPVYAVLWIVILSRHRPRRSRLAGLTCLCLAAGTVVLPLALFYLGHPDEWLAPLTRVSVFNWSQLRFLGMGDIPTGALIVQQLSRSLQGLVIIPTQGVYSPWTPMLRPPMAALAVIGIAFCLWRWRDARHRMLLVGIIGPILIGGLSLYAPNSQRLLFAMPPLVLTASLPLSDVSLRLRAWRPSRMTVSAAIPIALALAASLSDIRFFFAEAMPRGRFSDVSGLIARELADYLQTQPAGTKVYFVRLSGMGYFSNASLSYLAPNIEGHDLLWQTDPLPRLGPGDDRLIFVTLASETQDLRKLEQTYPNGEIITWVLDNRQPLFGIRLVLR